MKTSLWRDVYAFMDFDDDVKIIIEFWIPVLSSASKAFIEAMKSPTELSNVEQWIVDYCKDLIIERHLCVNWFLWQYQCFLPKDKKWLGSTYFIYNTMFYLIAVFVCFTTSAMNCLQSIFYIYWMISQFIYLFHIHWTVKNHHHYFHLILPTR